MLFNSGTFCFSIFDELELKAKAACVLNAMHSDFSHIRCWLFQDWQGCLKNVCMSYKQLVPKHIMNNNNPPKKPTTVL